MTRRTPRTVIEFVDTAPTSDPLIHKMREVHIDGVPVLVEKGGIDIEYGDDRATVVILRILATEVRFNHKPNQEAENGKA